MPHMNITEYDVEEQVDPWREVVAPPNLKGKLRIVSEDGVHVVFLHPGEQKLIHPALFRQALVAGCMLPGGSPGQEDTNENVVARLEAAMRKILDAGDANKLTMSGQPSAAALKMYVANFTSEQRDEAWENINAAPTPDEDEDD